MILVTSKFVYERSLQRDVAAVLSNLRAHVPQSHLHTVDHVVCELVDMFHEYDPSFDVAEFCERARAYHDLPSPEPEGASRPPARSRGSLAS